MASTRRLITELRQDVGYALRLLRRTPGFTAVALLTLALGIGGSTAIFTIVDAVLLRSLSFPEPERLAMIRLTPGARISAAYLHDWRLESQALEDMAGWQDARAILTGRDVPIEVLADQVTPNYFAVLGTPALLGRTFIVDPTLRTVEAAAVLSHGFWQRQFGGDPRVVGQSITLDGTQVTIIGVMPDGFSIRTNELAESRAEIWTPSPLVPGSRVGMGGLLNVVARLAPGATPEQAQAELALIARRIEQEHPSYSRGWSVHVVPLHEATVRDVRVRLLVLFGSVGILLLIACANVAGLTSSRVAARQTELTIRLSLGATGGRLARQFLAEGLVLAAAGGVLGVLAAVWGTELIVSIVPAGFNLPRTREIGVSLNMLGFASVVTIVAAVFFALVPSMGAVLRSPQSALREATRGASASRSRTLVGATFVITEVALALMLLAGAGLLGRSFWALSRVDPGFRTEQVITMRTSLPAAKYDTDDRIRAFSRELQERVQRLPGMRAAGFANYLPMSRFGAGGPFRIEGRAAARPEDRPGSWMSVVGGRFFEAMGIPLLRGRFPSEADNEKTEPVFVIDENLARRHWPDSDPIGARLIWRESSSESISGEIIGVVGSVHWSGLAADVQGITYFWFPQDPGRQLAIVARTTGDPIAMSRLIAAEVMAIDPNQPVAEIQPLQDFVSADLAQSRFTLAILGIFAAIALLLAAIGLYGVIAFAVAERTREIGVRIALGATRHDVLRLVMQRGLLLTGAGLAIGLAGALALGRTVTSLLYGVSPTDSFTLLAVAMFLTLVAMLASYLPARRATRVDPMVALRAD